MLKNGNVYPGQIFQVKLVVTDQDGNPADPDTVTLKTLSPYGDEASYVLGVDSEIQHVSTGIFTGDITPTIAGTWRFRWQGTGAYATVLEDRFNVKSSDFSPYGDANWGDYSL